DDVGIANILGHIGHGPDFQPEPRAHRFAKPAGAIKRPAVHPYFADIAHLAYGIQLPHGLLSGTDHSDHPRIFARHVARRDPARGAGAHHAHIAGLDYAFEHAADDVEQIDVVTGSLAVQRVVRLVANDS